MDPDQPVKDYQVILSPLAVQDLAEIVTFIAADNPSAAGQFSRALIEKTRLLKTFPAMGRVVPESESARGRVHGGYGRIFRVEIGRFWHGARGKPQI